MMMMVYSVSGLIIYRAAAATFKTFAYITVIVLWVVNSTTFLSPNICPNI
jgi:hypothetical protein